MTDSQGECCNEGIIGTIDDGNIGYIMRIGTPPHTGGVYQRVNTCGLQAFASRAQERAEACDGHFTPPAVRLGKAELFLWNCGDRPLL